MPNSGPATINAHHASSVHIPRTVNHRTAPHLSGHSWIAGGSPKYSVALNACISQIQAICYDRLSENQRAIQNHTSRHEPNPFFRE